jgi:hypothetical protein
MHQQPHARGAGVAEQVAVMGLCGAEHLHDAGQQPVDAGAHVDGLDRQPDGVDADHRRNSRSQAAHSAAALHGQLTLIATDPRRTSSRMSDLVPEKRSS